MFYSDLKQIYLIKTNSMTCSYSLIIDLSNDVFFHIFYCHFTKILEIETAVIGPKHQGWGLSKTNKN